MTIQQSNIKLLAAVVMDDADNNGGPPSSTIIPDGESNTVFPDISDLDRAGGRVRFRKVFPWVDEAGTSTFFGVNACLSDIPVDPATGVLLFEAASVSETQADVVARIGGVTGTLPAGFSSLISTEIYLRVNHTDAGATYWFDVSDALGAGFSSTINVGTQLTLIEFSGGSVVKYETKTVETVDTVNLVYAGSYYAILGLSAGLHSKWSAVTENSYWSDLVAPDAYGTYVIIGAAGIATDEFSYFGATRLTAGITSGDTVLPVAAVTQSVVPVSLIGTPDADTIIGFDPALLTKSPTGEEPIIQPGRFVVVGKTLSAAPATVSNGQTIDLGETGLSRVRVIGNDGYVITAGYTADLEAGTVTFENVAGYSQPVTVTGRIEDMARVISISTLNVTISRPVTHDYPSGSIVSAAVIFGDLRARVGDVWDQQTWTGEWSDDVIGSPAAAQYNQYAYPIVVTNQGAITERWRLQFTNTTTFNIVGEQVGFIGVGDTLSSTAPINPASGVPYLTLDPLGFGAGWSAGNVIRFNTHGAQAPVWMMEVIQPGPDYGLPDSCELAIRGDVDRP